MIDELEKDMQHIKDLKAQAWDLYENQLSTKDIKQIEALNNDIRYKEHVLNECQSGNDPQWQEECAEAARMKYPPLEVYLKECQ